MFATERERERERDDDTSEELLFWHDESRALGPKRIRVVSKNVVWSVRRGVHEIARSSSSTFGVAVTYNRVLGNEAGGVAA